MKLFKRYGQKTEYPISSALVGLSTKARVGKKDQASLTHPMSSGTIIGPPSEKGMFIDRIA